MNKWVLTVSLATALAATGAVQSAGNADAGKAKSATCAACHGADGNSVNPAWPKLAGQHSGFLVKQLADFKSGDRKDPVMSAQAMPLSEQDMADLAAFFSAQTAQPGTAAAESVELGQGIYRGGNVEAGVAACIACHGPAGKGNAAANFPVIAGQHADYVVKSLKDYHSGARMNDAGSMMQGVAGRMTDQEMKAVAQYVQGLR